MRLIARLPDQKQVGSLVDSLRNIGFDRKDMIISNLAQGTEEAKDDPEEIAGGKSFLKTEREGLWEAGAFADGIEGLEPGKQGIILAVELSKHDADRVRELMEQSGAIEILQD